MGAAFQWVQQNPNAFRAFLITFISMGGKLFLQLTGKSDQLEHLNDAVAQVIDLGLYGLMAYGVIMGSVHTTRGPALTSVATAATVVASIVPEPVSVVVAKVATVAEAVVAATTDKPALDSINSEPGIHKF
jgi:hypothetical protein